MKEVTGWYKCECHAEVLHIEEYTEPINLGEDLADPKNLLCFLYVSIWHLDSRRSFLDRLRHCWHILKTGRNYADEVELNWDNIKRLHEDLGNIIAKYMEEHEEGE